MRKLDSFPLKHDVVPHWNELEITDFTIVEKIVKVIFLSCLSEEIKKSPSFYSPLSISLHLNRLSKENLDFKKIFFYIL